MEGVGLGGARIAIDSSTQEYNYNPGDVLALVGRAQAIVTVQN